MAWVSLPTMQLVLNWKVQTITDTADKASNALNGFKHPWLLNSASGSLIVATAGESRGRGSK
eukprot:scaffold5628_cov103-Alexandrium_tamarense.AAC.1